MMDRAAWKRIKTRVARRSAGPSLARDLVPLREPFSIGNHYSFDTDTVQVFVDGHELVYRGRWRKCRPDEGESEADANK